MLFRSGIFRDLHIHDLDLVAWICESPIESIFATRTIRGPGAYAEFNDGDITRIVATTQSGVIASIEGARHDARGHDVRMEVHGSADSVGTGYTSRTPLHVIDEDAVHVDDRPYTGFIDRFRDAFRSETNRFVGVIQGAPNPSPPNQALAALKAAIACEVSDRTGATVQVDDIADDE